MGSPSMASTTAMLYHPSSSVSYFRTYQAQLDGCLLIGLLIVIIDVSLEASISAPYYRDSSMVYR